MSYTASMKKKQLTLQNRTLITFFQAISKKEEDLNWSFHLQVFRWNNFSNFWKGVRNIANGYTFLRYIRYIVITLHQPMALPTSRSYGPRRSRIPGDALGMFQRHRCHACYVSSHSNFFLHIPKITLHLLGLRIQDPKNELVPLLAQQYPQAFAPSRLRTAYSPTKHDPYAPQWQTQSADCWSCQARRRLRKPCLRVSVLDITLSDSTHLAVKRSSTKRKKR